MMMTPGCGYTDVYVNLSLALGEDLTPSQDLDGQIETVSKLASDCITTLYQFERQLNKQYKRHLKESHEA